MYKVDPSELKNWLTTIEKVREETKNKGCGFKVEKPAGKIKERTLPTWNRGVARETGKLQEYEEVFPNRRDWLLGQEFYKPKCSRHGLENLDVIGQ